MADQQKPDDPKPEVEKAAPASVICVTNVHVARTDKGGKPKLVEHKAGAKLPATAFSDAERAQLIALGALKAAE